MKKILTTFTIITFAFISCKKDKDSAPPSAPKVTTAALTNITSSGATTGGNIENSNGAAVTQSGIVWSKTNTTPTIADSIISAIATTGAFTTNITGLEFNRTYYIRAFATNNVGTGYGEVVTLNTTNDTNQVRFTYNGQEVTYGTIVSPTTGRKWLDRNLGAQQAATAFDDFRAYGDLFQWGRLDDGHQLINWTSSTVGTGVNAMIATLATSDNPGHNNFIDASSSSFWDWVSDNNGNRWATIPQGPCPVGWHVPTKDEWMAEVLATPGGVGTSTSGGITDYYNAYSLLKLTISGFRHGAGPDAGQLQGVGSAGDYWMSTVAGTNSRTFETSNINVGRSINSRSFGLSVRCIKDL